MIREETYTVQPKPQQLKVITIYICDICREDIGSKIGTRGNVCAICERFVHRNYKCSDEHPEDTSTDYPRTLCDICIRLWNTMYKPMQDRHEAEEEAMQQKIKEESLCVQIATITKYI